MYTYCRVSAGYATISEVQIHDILVYSLEFLLKKIEKKGTSMHICIASNPMSSGAVRFNLLPTQAMYRREKRRKEREKDEKKQKHKYKFRVGVFLE